MSKLVKNLLIDDLRSTLARRERLLAGQRHRIELGEDDEAAPELRKKNIHLQVIKNSMARRATEGTPLAPAFEGVEGTLAVVWGGEDVVSLAKDGDAAGGGQGVPGVGGAWRRD